MQINAMEIGEPFQVSVFPALKYYRSLSFKDRKTWTLRLPCQLINGFAGKDKISLQLAQRHDNKHILILLDLSDNEPLQEAKK